MRTKIIGITVLILLFINFLIFLNLSVEETYVSEVTSPIEIKLKNNTLYKVNDFDSFDSYYSVKNKNLALRLNLTEDEAFILGNLAKYWAENILNNRKVFVSNDDLIYYKYSYKRKFENSAFCIKNNEFTNNYAAQKLIKNIRKSNYMIFDMDTEEYLPLDKNFRSKNYIVLKKGYKKHKKFSAKTKTIFVVPLVLNNGNFKIIISDFTQKLKPDRNCSTEMCKEILNNINSAKTSIDFAIYGYSSVPSIENAIKNAKARGVKIRLVYDIDTTDSNIYPNTNDLVKLVANTKNDSLSKEKSAIMHNKFYVFDNKIVITGSANLSHTDMSGYNSNAIIVINSPAAAKIYTEEFNQMYEGKFHSDKILSVNNSGIYFSPQNKTIQNTILPLIKNSKNYIYIPAFLISHKGMVTELIQAKNRGVDVRIITDALNASAKYSKVRELRAAGMPVKIENYAGKMHSKTMIIDDKYLILGSMNFSKNGESKNDENLIVLENKEAAIFYKQFFLYLWDKIPDKWLKFYPRAEGLDSIGSCSDGVDNDYDGLVDMEEESCKKLKK